MNHNQNKPSKIFQINVNGEKEWIAANTNIGALMIYLSTTEMDIVDFEHTDNIVEVPKEKWSDLKITNPDKLNDDESPMLEMSFEEYMQSVERPELFCSTCY